MAVATCTHLQHTHARTNAHTFTHIHTDTHAGAHTHTLTHARACTGTHWAKTGPAAFVQLAEEFAPYGKPTAQLRGQAQCRDGEVYVNSNNNNICSTPI